MNVYAGCFPSWFLAYIPSLSVSNIAFIFINTSHACRGTCLPIVAQQSFNIAGSRISRSISNDYDDICFPLWFLACLSPSLPVSSIAAVFINTSPACTVPRLPISATIVQHTHDVGIPLYVERLFTMAASHFGFLSYIAHLPASIFYLPCPIFCFSSFIFHLPSSIFGLLLSAFYLLPSAFCLPPSAFCLLHSVFRLSASVSHLSAPVIQLLLLNCCLSLL